LDLPDIRIDVKQEFVGLIALRWIGGGGVPQPVIMRFSLEFLFDPFRISRTLHIVEKPAEHPACCVNRVVQISGLWQNAVAEVAAGFDVRQTEAEDWVKLDT
jgi:hypothetical protein